MKDIQGIQRGKCNSCECEEYRTAAQPQGGSLRCEYCNHTPGEHVRIIELGACRDCGKEECDKYQSEDPNSYTDCGYCGCGADKHAGAEKLRKPTSHPPSQQGGMAPPGQGMPQAQDRGMSAGFQPRQNAYGQAVQMPAFGNCKCPGCKFPKRIEGDKIHDFCSRTCARKFREMESTFFQQKKMAATQAVQQGGPPQASVQSQPPTGGSLIPSTSGSSTTGSGGGFLSSLFGSSSTPDPQSGGPPSSSGGGFLTSAFGSSSTSASQSGGPPPSTGGKLCTKCRTRAANPGKGWCQQCYQQSNS